MAPPYDLIVLGGGPAGYVAALRAAQLGKRVACIEQERLGGTCGNWGCIPSKALLKSAEVFELFSRAQEFGLRSHDHDFDFPAIIERSRSVAARMAGGVKHLFEARGVDELRGKGLLLPDRKVRLIRDDGEETLAAEHILLATGCRPRTLPFLPVQGERVMTSRQALASTVRPESVAIIGGGAIGVEFAYFYSVFGSRVTIVELLPSLLPGSDAEVAKGLTRSLSKRGIQILTGAKVESARIGEKSVLLEIGGKAPQRLEVSSVLVAIGVEPNLDSSLAPGVSLEKEGGFVKVDSRYETSLPGVFAAGDIIGPPLLAHVAFREGMEAVEGLFVPGKVPARVDRFPSCVYSQPQVAMLGLTEEQARERKLAFRVGRYPYTANGKAMASGDSTGFVKILFSEPHGEILGAHILGAEASELIAELSVTIASEGTSSELHDAIHPHPTLSEMIGEAALVAEKRPLHI
ncbi:dihydrolipoamide dehydrogenase [Methylacidimicrobium cyclopophantes]|uniref:Dihydrolipoyl dehydrogenase n=1 Tax=Methylacidimicrobium cyclopophantes TaxID=1041766 RepID=A0A5E6MKE4_9BACT|nr:dihydrolipoyl dehydrogenase [Methylacidimicrobium cyclopophantes]VVM08557.1 dihydrolipoamide dehydrogenase [Methylacidimicrobium cyclopophantes]